MKAAVPVVLNKEVNNPAKTNYCKEKFSGRLKKASHFLLKNQINFKFYFACLSQPPTFALQINREVEQR